MSKRVVRKSASASKPRRKLSVASSRVAPDAIQNPEANAAERARGKSEKPQPAKNVAKVVSLIVSIGNDDESSWEEFLEGIKKSIGAVEPPWMDDEGNRKPGPHVALSGGYYILDGKVCQPQDYDPKNRTFKKGTYPPEWAGGPGKSQMSQQQQMDYDSVNLTSDEYDRKYKIGKYEPARPAHVQQKGESASEHDARMKRERAAKAAAEVEDYEEFSEADLYDDDKMGGIADASASAAIKKLQGSKKRVIKKKPATPKKRVVKRTKSQEPPW